MIYILLFVIGCLLIDKHNLKFKNKILYNNYHTALNVIAESDPELKEYLERGISNI